MNQSVTISLDAGVPVDTGTSKRAFARHFVEMVFAMFAGMAVFGGLATLIEYARPHA